MKPLISILSLTLLGTTAGLHAQEATAEAPATIVTSPVVDERWEAVEDAMDLIMNPALKPASREEAVANFREGIEEFDKAFAAYIEVGTEDDRRWVGKLFEARLAKSRKIVGLEEGASMMTILTNILNDEAAPTKFKSEASAATLIESANDAKNTEEGRTSWLAKLETHFETYPKEPLNDDLKATSELMKPLELAFTGINGEEFDLSKLRGKVVALDFWATWSEASLDALPELLEIYEEFHPKGFEIAGISLDKHKEDVEEVVEDRKIPWIQQFEGRRQEHRLAKRFGIGSIPEMWLIDQEGMVVDMHARRGLKAKIQHLLEAKAEPESPTDATVE